jgi:hypothetical protein
MMRDRRIRGSDWTVWAFPANPSSVRQTHELEIAARHLSRKEKDEAGKKAPSLYGVFIRYRAITCGSKERTVLFFLRHAL